MSSSAWCDGGVPAWLRLTASVVIASLPACAEVPVAEDQPGYHLVTEEIWSGGDLMLVSPSFQGMLATVRVVIDGDTFPTVYRRADTAVFRLTPMRSGAYPITLLPPVRPAPDSPDQVTVRGFAGCYPGPPMTGYPLPWPERYRLSTFVADGAESAIIVDAATGQSRLAVPPADYSPGVGAGPGWAYEPGSVALGGCMWRLEPSPERGECPGGSSSYTLAVLGPGKWVFATHHMTFTTFGPSGSLRSFYLEEPDGLTVSPRGDYAIVSGFNDAGQLLIPAAEQDSVRRIPSLRRSEPPATFTPDGDTVYMVGEVHRTGDTAMTLVVLDVARPAAPIAKTELPRASYTDIAVDPAAPYLYVGPDYYGTIIVLDRETLRSVGTLQPDSICRIPGHLGRLRLARNSGALYVIRSLWFRGSGPNHPPPPSWIFRYDLPTPQATQSPSNTPLESAGR